MRPSTCRFSVRRHSLILLLERTYNQSQIRAYSFNLFYLGNTGSGAHDRFPVDTAGYSLSVPLTGPRSSLLIGRAPQILLCTRTQSYGTKYSMLVLFVTVLSMFFSQPTLCLHHVPLGLCEWLNIKYRCVIANPSCGQVNRERNFSLPPLAYDDLISRDRFDHPVPHQSAHSQHSCWIWCFLISFFPLFRSARPCPIHTIKQHRVIPEFIKCRNCVIVAFTAESPLTQGE